MVRTCVAALLSMVVLTASAAGAEVRGIIAGVDASKGTLTLKFEPLAGATPKADQEFKVPGAIPIVDLGGKALKDGLKDKRVVPGIKATVTTETKAGKEVVTKVRIHTEPE